MGGDVYDFWLVWAGVGGGYCWAQERPLCDLGFWIGIRLCDVGGEGRMIAYFEVVAGAFCAAAWVSRELVRG